MTDWNLPLTTAQQGNEQQPAAGEHQKRLSEKREKGKKRRKPATTVTDEHGIEAKRPREAASTENNSTLPASGIGANLNEGIERQFVHKNNV